MSATMTLPEWMRQLGHAALGIPERRARKISESKRAEIMAVIRQKLQGPIKG